MNNKIIVIKNNNGSCSILHPAPEMFDPNSRTRQALLENQINFKDDEEVLQFIINKDVPEGAAYRITTIDKLPSDKSFRNAWTDNFDTETVDVDIEKAKELHKNTLRALRSPILAKLDVDYMRADEAGNEELKKAIVEKKQALRDVTDLPLPEDVAQLKEFIPDILKNG